jgi:hypothetical protein
MKALDSKSFALTKLKNKKVRREQFFQVGDWEFGSLLVYQKGLGGSLFISNISIASFCTK